MKILHITFSLRNAGKENILVDIANEQQKNGNKVAILIINDSIDPTVLERVRNEILIFQIHRKSESRKIKDILKLIYILNWKFKANVIHSHDPDLGFLLKFVNQAPTVLTIHGPGFNISKMKYYDRLIAVSKAVKNDVESRCKCKCEVIYNGIDLKSIKRKKHQLQNENFKIVTIGRLEHEIKGQDLVIKAAYDLTFNKGYLNLRFFFIGEGESRSYLEDLISKMKLDRNVFLLGNKSREWIFDNLNKYDLLIQPSRLEGFGLTVAEAVAAKIPVIASNLEGPAEILEYGKFGIMFQNNDSNSLVKKIEQMIDLYKNDEIMSLINSAYEHFNDIYSISNTAKQYSDCYKELILIPTD